MYILDRKAKRTIASLIVVLIVIAACVFAYAETRDDGTDIIESGINYQGNGGLTSDGDTVEGVESYVVLDGEGMFQREGYVFVGWNTRADGSGTGYMPGDVVESDEGVRLFAQWSYALTISWNSGNGSATDLLYQLTDLNHEQVDIAEGRPTALPDSPWTTLSVIKTGTQWNVDNDSLTITGVLGDTTYTISIDGYEGASSIYLSTIVWDGQQYPLIILEYEGPVHLSISDGMTSSVSQTYDVSRPNAG